MDPLTIQLALGLAAEGMRQWATFAERTAAGQTTTADCEAMAAKLGSNIDALLAEIAAKRAEQAAGPNPTPPPTPGP